VSDLEPRRRVTQNSLLWAVLTDVSKQLDWPHTENGKWVFGKMPPMSWKAVFSAGFFRQLDMAQGIDGGSVMLGASTSNMGVKQFAEMMEYIFSEAIERGVVFSEKAVRIREEHGAKT
jgi:hypothetical protein